MRIDERGNVLTARAAPGCIWIFGLWFVAGGVLAMLMTFVATNAHELAWWERLLAFSIGAACAVAGLFVIFGALMVHAVFDRTTNRALVTTTGLRARTRVEFACSDVVLVGLKVEKDGDGDPMYRVQLSLRDGRLILLQSQPTRGRQWCAARAEVIRRFLGLSPAQS